MASVPMLRLATVDDAVRVAVLAEQLGYASDTIAMARRLAPILANRDHAVFVAELDGAVVGWLHVLVPASLLSDGTAEIAGLVIDERHRSRGLGDALLARAEQWACGCGCRAVRVRSNVTRSRAHVFYERLDYRLTKVSKVFEKRLADEI